MAPVQMSQTRLTNVRNLILSARRQVAQPVNVPLTMLFSKTGGCIHQDIIEEQRAAYEAKIVQTLSAQLTVESSRRSPQRNLAFMVRFADVFPDLMIVQSLITQLGWTHFKALIPIEDPLRWESDAKMGNQPWCWLPTIRATSKACRWYWS